MSADDHHPPAAPPPDPVTDPKWLGPVVGFAFALLVVFGLGVASVAAYNSESGDSHSEDGDHSDEGDHSEDGDHSDDEDHSEDEDHSDE